MYLYGTNAGPGFNTFTNKQTHYTMSFYIKYTSPVPGNSII